jgi:hypothetical protein
MPCSFAKFNDGAAALAAVAVTTPAEMATKLLVAKVMAVAKRPALKVRFTTTPPEGAETPSFVFD